TLLKSDCISYVVVPVARIEDIEREVKRMSKSIQSIVMLNCGGLFNIEDFVEISENVTMYILDNHRPVNLRNAFWNNEVIVFHEKDLDKDLAQEKEAIVFTEENEYEAGSDDESGSDNDERPDRLSDREDNSDNGRENDDDEEGEEGSHRRRRRRTGLDSEVIPESMRKQWKASRAIVIEHMSKGVTFGTSIANQSYMMATQLDRSSSNLLWLAIVGLSSQYLADQIGHEAYLEKVQLYKDEAERLTPTGPGDRNAITGISAGINSDVTGTGGSAVKGPEDGAINCTDEYRFMMVRHWSLYEKECSQVFTHMSIELKKILKDRIELVGPEYGLYDTLYTSFTRSYGYRGVMSASDVVYAVTGLLESSPEASIALGFHPEASSSEPMSGVPAADETHGGQGDHGSPSWWHDNFFRACDALESSGSDREELRQGLDLCMKTLQAVVRQGIAIIEKQVIITLSRCRVATLKDGPDLPIFWNPITLNKLAQFLVYAIREYGSARPGIRPIPLVVAVLKEETQTFIVTGVHGSPVMGEAIPNKFGIVFEKISYNEGIPIKYLGFDKSVVE
ncbi:hypothetical protein BGW38_006518, partial [Lunasporangiospora selenospora]